MFILNCNCKTVGKWKKPKIQIKRNFLHYRLFFIQIFIYSCIAVACTTEETKLCLSLSAKQHQNPCSGAPPVYQDLITCHDWPVKKDIVDFPVRMKGNLKRTSSNLLSPLGDQNKDLGTALQTLLTEIKVRL